jgi:hypothetical protein
MSDREIIIALLEILSKPLQEGGYGMADCGNSPLARLLAAAKADWSFGVTDIFGH